jgi:hypothetical protein
MNAFPRFKNVGQSLENSFSSSLDTCRESTLPIAAIKIHDLGAKFVLKVCIYKKYPENPVTLVQG